MIDDMIMSDATAAEALKPEGEEVNMPGPHHYSSLPTLQEEGHYKKKFQPRKHVTSNPIVMSVHSLYLLLEKY